MSLKKKRSLSLLLTTQNFLLMILIEKILMKKIKYQKVSYDKLFYFSSLGWKVQSSISGNIRKAFFWENIRKVFFWENIGKVFYWENINIFLILQLKSSISRKKKIFFQGEFFWVFLDFGLVCAGFHFQKYKKSFNRRVRK